MNLAQMYIVKEMKIWAFKSLALQPPANEKF